MNDVGATFIGDTVNTSQCKTFTVTSIDSSFDSRVRDPEIAKGII